MNETTSALGWEEVASRLAGSPVIWVHTNGRSGAPQATPVWGVVVDEVFYIYSQSSTAKARNLKVDPRALVHLESGRDVLIVHGELQFAGIPTDSPMVTAAFAAKYAAPDEAPFLPSSDPTFDVLYLLKPRKAVSWSLPDTDASTRIWTASL